MASDLLYVVCPGYVISRSDGDQHFITAGQLIRLYGLQGKRYVVEALGRVYPDDAVYLRPRFDGDYIPVGEQHG